MNTPHDNTRLTHHDLQFALIRTPKVLLRQMKRPEWSGKIFVGGGFLRSVVAGESINDVDVFVSSVVDAKALARVLVIDCLRLKLDGSEEQEKEIKRRIYETDNALTITCIKPTVQIIHRWVFDSANAAANSFDFTCCAAMFWWGAQKDMVDGQENPPNWHSYCDTRFYPDIAAKRLIYRSPVRNEEAGGSMLRVLKYYQKGYRIPLDSMAAVIARLVKGVDLSKCTIATHNNEGHREVRVEEFQFAKVICGLLREVDPNIDPNHIAHLPPESSDENVADEV